MLKIRFVPWIVGEHQIRALYDSSQRQSLHDTCKRTTYWNCLGSHAERERAEWERREREQREQSVWEREREREREREQSEREKRERVERAECERERESRVRERREREQREQRGQRWKDLFTNFNSFYLTNIFCSNVHIWAILLFIAHKILIPCTK